MLITINVNVTDMQKSAIWAQIHVVIFLKISLVLKRVSAFCRQFCISGKRFAPLVQTDYKL